MPPTSQEFKNDTITATIIKKPGCSIHLEVTASPLATQAAYQKAIKTVGKEVSIPGFRKGKAPKDILIKNFGKHIESEWKDVLLNTTFREAIKLTNTLPFKDESVSKASIKSVSLENGATLLYDYESQPETPSISPEEITIKHTERKPVTEDDITHTLENLRLQHAEWTEITDRPAAEGDFVDIDIDSIESPEHNICKETRFEIVKGKMGAWMRELIVGMTPGQSAEKMSEKEDEDEQECTKCDSGEEHEKHDHFKPTLCRIKLHTIKTPTLPAFDDELAKKFGVQTVEELNKRVSDDLNKQADEEQTSTLRKKTEQAILSKYAFDLPRTIIEGQVDSQIEQIVVELKERGLEGDALEKETARVKHDVTERLDKDFRLYFLAQKVIQDHEIQVLQDELMQELMRQMWLQQSGQSIITPEMEAQEVRSRLYASVLVNKAIDYIAERAKRA